MGSSSHIRMLCAVVMLAALCCGALGAWILQSQAYAWAAHAAEARHVALASAWPAELAPEARLHSGGLVGLRLYGSSGEMLFTTGGARPTAELRAQPLPHTDIQSLKASGLQAAGAVSHVARSLVATPGGFAELFSDISPAVHVLWLAQALVAGVALLVACIGVWALGRTHAHAENIVTEEHDQWLELKARAAEAEERAQTKSMFIANMSHELRTPLNAIIGFSEVIKQDMATKVPDPRFASFINDIHQAGLHLLALITDILDFSKAEAGKLELDIEETNISKLVANCLRLVAPRAESGQVQLINELPKEPFVAETDSQKLKQVLLNLLSNAVKFTPAGGNVTISGWHDLGSDTFFLRVRDTGMGMDGKNIARAMSPFGQADHKMEAKKEGTGLGLPIARTFMDAMGGNFILKSEPGQGTTITLSIPRAFQPRDGMIYRRTGP